ncbi:MAG: CvpA family protein [Chloroflexi bacterium]|nr:CvpA family protein [Chloroflexota bacterium]
MISLQILLFIFVILFAIIGAMRGWAKELLVTFSILLALFAMVLLENYVSFFKKTIQSSLPGTVFCIRAGVLTLFAFFGYQAPRIQKLVNSGRFVRHFIQDSLLGGILGAVNGYLIFGTLWYYLHATGYPFSFVFKPDLTTTNGIAALNWIHYLPPAWLMGTPAIYIAVGICFIFVLVVFL